MSFHRTGSGLHVSLLLSFVTACSGAADQPSGGSDAAADGSMDAPEAAPSQDVLVETRDAVACTAGERVCEGDVPRTCTAEGAWFRGAPCPFGCASGSCQGECSTGAVDCAGNVPLTCVDGKWQAGTACAALCSRGVCQDSCSKGALECAGRTRRACTNGDAWDTDQVCPYVCAGAACAGECTPSEVDCAPDGRTPRVCGKDGRFVGGDPCPGVCRAGVCVESCAAGESQCSGKQRLACSTGGTWTAAESCPFVCRNGTCSGTCVPGARRCSIDGTRAEDCDGGGNWTPSTPCPNGCAGDGVCAKSDAGAEASAPEAGASDVGVESSSAEASVDGGADSGPVQDATVDVGPVDATVDADSTPPDAGSDVAPDVAPDAASDARGDAIAESGTDGGDAASPPMLSCAFVGPRVLVADYGNNNPNDESSRMALASAAANRVVVLYTNIAGQDTVVATFDPAAPAGLVRRNLGLFGRVAHTSPWTEPGRHTLIITTGVPGPDTGLVMLPIENDDYGNPRSVATLAGANGTNATGAVGHYDPSGNGGAGSYAFGFAWQYFQDTTYEIYAGVATPGQPVAPRLAASRKAGRITGVQGILTSQTRFMFAEDLESPDSEPTRILSIPMATDFQQADVSIRAISSTLTRAYLGSALRVPGENAHTVSWFEYSPAGPTFRFSSQTVTPQDWDTFSPISATPFAMAGPGDPLPPGGPASDVIPTTLEGKRGLLMLGSPAGASDGLTLYWVTLEGTKLVVPVTGDAGTQPTLLPGVGIREVRALQELQPGPYTFHLTWRTASATAGNESVYYDKLQCTRPPP